MVLAEFWFLMVKEEMERFQSSLVFALLRTYCRGELFYLMSAVGFNRGSFSRYSQQGLLSSYLCYDWQRCFLLVEDQNCWVGAVSRKPTFPSSSSVTLLVAGRSVWMYSLREAFTCFISFNLSCLVQSRRKRDSAMVRGFQTAGLLPEWTLWRLSAYLISSMSAKCGRITRCGLACDFSSSTDPSPVFSALPLQGQVFFLQFSALGSAMAAIWAWMCLALALRLNFFSRSEGGRWW